MLLAVGLGLAAGAIFHPASAQDTSRVRPDSAKARVPIPVRADSLARPDSTAPKQPPDTLQPPLAHAPVPRLMRSDSALHFDRAQIFATGSLTLQDLLARVLIATPYSAGYVSAPANVAVGGDFRRTRVFIDGIEYDAIDARSNGLIDYSQIQLWSAEDITIEQTATEVRVHLRTWRVDNTAPYTRMDIGTGDQQLNLYRGFFGRRFGGGQVLQLGAQQYGTTPPTYLGSSADQLGIIGRVGWASARYSIDGFATHVSRHRGTIRAFGRIDSLPDVESTRSDAYLRLGFRDVDTSATWAQVVASKGSYRFSPSSSGTTTSVATDTTHRDTTQSQLQYFVAVGANSPYTRASLGARIRHSGSATLITPVVTASYALGRLTVRSNLEGRSADSLSRWDAAGEYMGTLMRIGAASDRAVDHRTNSAGLVTGGFRAWAGIRLMSLWVDGGMIFRDSAALIAPSILGATGTTIAGPANGTTLRVSGRVWKALFADINVLEWSDTAAVYRPKYQTRSELFVRTTLPDRFPQGNFGLLISARHEYRSASLIPSGTGLLRAQGERSISTLVEVKIYSAVASWQVRNVIGTLNYQAANYLSPRTTNFYGVRWDFWN